MTTKGTEEAERAPSADRPMPTNVIQALARVMEDLPAIEKKRHPSPDGDRGVTYPYRGIEEITAEAQGLCAKYGVVAIPWKTVPIETREFQVKSGATWTDEKIEVHWRIYGPGGTEDMIEAQTLGIGRDNSDKGFNKGATQALKYLLLPMLLVADPKDDADGKTQENDGDAKKTTTRKPPLRRSQVPDGQATVSAPNPASRTSAPSPSRDSPLLARAEAEMAGFAEGIRQAPTRDGEPEEDWHKSDEEQRASGEGYIDHDQHGDIATMDLRTLTAALEAAGLSVAGNSAQKRLRLQEHRSGVPAAALDPNVATDKARGLMNGLFKGYSRGQRLDAITELIERPIESTSQMTAAEVTKVIEIMKPEEES